MTNEQIFVMFLKKHRKYTSYKKQFDKNLESSNVRDIIDTSFYWRDTKEGNKYWQDLDAEWEELCEHFDLTGNIYLSKV